jgi:AcrR family transcriptional regulator
MSSETRDTRSKILGAALALLEAGGGAVRMADIAKAAGVSRQAVYLHFATRADLLIAATRHLDEIKDVDARLRESRAAQSGVERLDAYIEAWGNYIPEVYGVARALLELSQRDAEAAAAWVDRMEAMRDGCAAAVKALKRDGALSENFSVAKATDVLAALLSIRNWEQLVQENGWSQRQYIEGMKTIARASLVRHT